MFHNSVQAHLRTTISLCKLGLEDNLFFARLVRIGSAVFVGASIVLPAQSLLASTYDGQGVHLNSGESVQVNCASGTESTAQLNQFGNTHYYSLRCTGGSSGASSSTPAVVETSGSQTTVHLDHGSSVHLICYGGDANLTAAGNTRYYALNCN